VSGGQPEASHGRPRADDPASARAICTRALAEAGSSPERVAEQLLGVLVEDGCVAGGRGGEAAAG
jgi:hypothetical protein